jgi:hypothetical protein
VSRRIATAFIAVYLGVLGYGLASHTVGFRTYQHVAMYFVVWDMYCGWSGWETRSHLIGEGESGAYYDLSHGPWGEIKMFGDLGREHYDSGGNFAVRLAKNVADHTQHEPITRYLFIEEAWSKKYNLPEFLWSRRIEEPKEFRSYHRIRAAYDSDGVAMVVNPNWTAWLNTAAIGKNPRLVNDVKKSQPHITSDQFARAPNVVVPIGYESSQPPQR